MYYFNERVEEDRLILSKLQYDGPLSNWIELVKELQIDPAKITSKNTRALIVATNAGSKGKAKTISQRMFRISVG